MQLFEQAVSCFCRRLVKQLVEAGCELSYDVLLSVKGRHALEIFRYLLSKSVKVPRGDEKFIMFLIRHQRFDLALEALHAGACLPRRIARQTGRLSAGKRTNCLVRWPHTVSRSLSDPFDTTTTVPSTMIPVTLSTKPCAGLVMSVEMWRRSAVSLSRPRVN